jgi:hypothetical protein
MREKKIKELKLFGEGREIEKLNYQIAVDKCC